MGSWLGTLESQDSDSPVILSPGRGPRAGVTGSRSGSRSPGHKVGMDMDRTRERRQGSETLFLAQKASNGNLLSARGKR